MGFSKLKWLAVFLAVAALLWASGIAPSAYNTIISGSSTLASRSVLKFTNGGCVDNSGTTPPETDCTIGGVLFSQTQTVTDAVQTTETTLVGSGSGSKIIPANFYAAGTTVKFEASGFYSTTASPGTLTIKVKHSGGTTGTVIVGNTGAMTPLASITNGVWRLWGNITFRTTGTGGTGIMNTVWEGEPSSLSALTPADASIVNTTTFTVDTTAAQTVDLTAAWSAASQSISCTNLILYSPNGSNGGGGGGGSFSVNGYYLNDGTNNYIGQQQNVVTLPVLGAFSFLTTQGTATGTTQKSAVLLTTPSAAGDNVRCFGQAIGANTTLTVALSVTTTLQNFVWGGVGFFESGTGKLVILQSEQSTSSPNPGIENTDVGQWTNATSFSSLAFQYGDHTNSGELRWYQIQKTGGNLNFKISRDGQNFTQIFTQAQNAFFTTAPDNWCIAADGNSSGGSTSVFVVLYSWLMQ